MNLLNTRYTYLRKGEGGFCEGFRSLLSWKRNFSILKSFFCTNSFFIILKNPNLIYFCNNNIYLSVDAFSAHWTHHPRMNKS